MLRRVHVVYRAEVTPDGCVPPAWRVVEADGSLCVNWLSPDFECDDDLPLDKGGFDDRKDAELFALGVTWERAFHGLLEGVTTTDIDRQRDRYDRGARVSVLDDLDLDDGPPIPFSARPRPAPSYSYYGPSWLF